jgi:penicillin G amidase
LRNQTLGSKGSPVAFLFNRGGYRLAGGGSLVDATSWDAAKGYGATSVPSMRMIVPLNDLDAAQWINLTGASGHAFDGHYTDQTKLWEAGETLRWPFTREAVQSSAADTLVLEPSH